MSFAFMLSLYEYIRQILVFLTGEEMGENSISQEDIKFPQEDINVNFYNMIDFEKVIFKTQWSERDE